ncbi:cardiolipin synthase [Halospina denitrificans]|uniref:Cardiolipin synthase n=1 Tax=Halospina denitrificans TaxID=332522 RepID=A0A4R7JL08_9GAMM|nr:phospholipase D-like domain-containing protein [Halospina denitrificans]TDT37777.1 cardiolipin synthase [Halospina denitrificans]
MQNRFRPLKQDVIQASQRLRPGRKEARHFGVIGQSRPLPLPALVWGRVPLMVYTEGDALYEAMLDAIRNAHTQVWLESYIFSSDVIGERFTQALCERARAGVDVRVHVDAAGCLFWGFDQLEPELVAAGVQVKWFHPWTWRDPFRYNRRNHRKLLVVDGEAAFFGGFNIHRENSLREYGELRWRDTHCLVEGELALEAAALFEALWVGDRGWMPRMPERPSCVLVTNQGIRRRHALSRLILRAFARARKRIYVTTPYFIPNENLQRRMIAAARAGVDVRLLVPERGDVGLAHWASRIAFRPLLRQGVRIFYYGPRLLHAKTIVVDGEWTTIGTANMDYRSFLLNYELNLVSRDPGIGEVLENQFFEDLESSQELREVSRLFASPVEHCLGMLAWFARRLL